MHASYLFITPAAIIFFFTAFELVFAGVICIAADILKPEITFTFVCGSRVPTHENLMPLNVCHHRMST